MRQKKQLVDISGFSSVFSLIFSKKFHKKIENITIRGVTL
mgnify:CR=1 FL=1